MEELSAENCIAFCVCRLGVENNELKWRERERERDEER